MDRKSACFIAAAQLTVASAMREGPIIGGGQALAPDPQIAGESVRKENLEIWELFRIFYAACSQAMDDETSWTSPKSGPGQSSSKLADLATALTPFASQLAPGVLNILNAAGVIIQAGAKTVPPPKA